MICCLQSSASLRKSRDFSNRSGTATPARMLCRCSSDRFRQTPLAVSECPGRMVACPAEQTRFRGKGHKLHLAARTRSGIHAKSGCPCSHSTRSSAAPGQDATCHRHPISSGQGPSTNPPFRAGRRSTASWTAATRPAVDRCQCFLPSCSPLLLPRFIRAASL